MHVAYRTTKKTGAPEHITNHRPEGHDRHHVIMLYRRGTLASLSRSVAPLADAEPVYAPHGAASWSLVACCP
jgi:hypothetical protein